MSDLLLYRRPDGREASRADVLVMPAVVCSNAVTTKIAEAARALSVTHQHGCAQVGDDARHTSVALEELALHPNAWGTLVVSLGCETLQGVRLVERVRAAGAACSLVGIQDSGGSRAAIENGIAECRALVDAIPEREPSTKPVRVGVAFKGETASLAAAYASALAAASGLVVEGPLDISQAPVLELGEFAWRHRLLGLVLVSDRGLPAAPVLVPLLAIASSQAFFDDAEGEYDLAAPSDEALVVSCIGMLSGQSTEAERRRDSYFAIRRSLVTL